MIYVCAACVVVVGAGVGAEVGMCGCSSSSTFSRLCFAAKVSSMRWCLACDLLAKFTLKSPPMTISLLGCLVISVDRSFIRSSKGVSSSF